MPWFWDTASSSNVKSEEVGPDVPTALVLGRTGAGKSTFCNYLLYGKPQHSRGFPIHSKSEPLTLECVTKKVLKTVPPSRTRVAPGGELAVIDTPGLPDPWGRTRICYDSIVRAVRGRGKLNACFLVLNDNVDDEAEVTRDFKAFGPLLKQFNQMPCPKILVCRTQVLTGADPAGHVKMAVAESGMFMTRTEILKDDDDWAVRVLTLREMVYDLPMIPIQEWHLRTFNELKRSFQRLSEDTTRAQELEAKNRALEAELNGLAIPAGMSKEIGRSAPGSTMYDDDQTRIRRSRRKEVLTRERGALQMEKATCILDQEARKCDAEILSELLNLEAHEAEARRDSNQTEDSGTPSPGMSVAGILPPFSIIPGADKLVLTILVMGTSGAGKSTLCNHLLYGNPSFSRGFRVRKDSQPTTIRCSKKAVSKTHPPAGVNEAPAGMLAVIDTPGFPAPGGSSLKYFDNIVETARKQKKLGAVIFIFNAGDEQEKVLGDVKTYSPVLKQLNRLACPVILLCRCNMPEDVELSEKHARYSSLYRMLESIPEKHGIHVAKLLILTEDKDWSRQVFKLRTELSGLLPMPTCTWSMRTSRELIRSLERLVDERTRGEELKARKQGLEEEYKTLHFATTRALETSSGSSLSSNAAVRDLHGWSQKENLMRIEVINEEIEAINAEEEAGTPREEVLNHDKQILEELKTLRSREVPEIVRRGSFRGSSRAQTPVVVIIGKSGVGKSTLGNYLLLGSPRPKGGFAALRGGEPVTKECLIKEVESTPPQDGVGTSPGPGLAVIDTPGLPDPEQRTLTFYNNIVETVRRQGELNAMILMLCVGSDREQVGRDMKTCGLLFRQFNRLPCPKILVCRVRLLEGMSDVQNEEEMSLVYKWIGSILLEGAIDIEKTVILDARNSMREYAHELRAVVSKLPPMRIGEWCLRTHEELTSRAKRLVDESTRREELGKKRTSLLEESFAIENSMYSLELWDVAIQVATACDFVLKIGAFHSSMATMVIEMRDRRLRGHEERLRELGVEIDTIDRELAGCELDEEAFKCDKEHLRELEDLARVVGDQ